MARKSLTDRQISLIKPADRRQTIADPELAGHYVRVTPAGAKSFCAVARNPAGKQVWVTLGSCAELTIAEARVLAIKTRARILRGLPVTEESPATFGDVADSWLQRHVDAKRLRSAPEIRRILAVYVRPTWQSRAMTSIRRADVTTLIDTIEDNHGRRQADYTLSIVRAILNWHAARDENFINPIVRGMRRMTPTKRERILDDDEIRAVWLASEGMGTYGAIVRTCTLTAQRAGVVAAMRWADVRDGVWHIPQEPRAKGNGKSLKLPATALAIIEAQPHIAGHDYVFSGRGAGPFNAWSQCKNRLDKTAAVTGWTIHDLRRTARSLMSRAGVRPEIAERVMGHEIPGVGGIYDRHSYAPEKAAALEMLAMTVADITRQPPNVVAIERQEPAHLTA